MAFHAYNGRDQAAAGLTSAEVAGVGGRNPRPMQKLGPELLSTYHAINASYYQTGSTTLTDSEIKEEEEEEEEEEESESSPGCTPRVITYEEHDYILRHSGEMFDNRYRFTGLVIGRGSFGQVIEALDTKNGQKVAIKIVKRKKAFLMQAGTEIDLLQHIISVDKHDEYSIVRFLDYFGHHGHQCMVFELLSVSLYDILQKNAFTGIQLSSLRIITRQVLQALVFLSRKDVNIIHCDLKPENILLVESNKTAVKVIDFGSSCKSHHTLYQYIQSRYYRSPEVLLGLPYTEAIDMWSLGCILMEMYTGEPLFTGVNQPDQMHKIIRMRGLPPLELIQAAPQQFQEHYFRQVAAGRFELKQQQQVETGKRSLESVVAAKKKCAAGSQKQLRQFLDLVDKMLTYRAQDRITPDEALRHPFFCTARAQSSKLSRRTLLLRKKRTFHKVTPSKKRVLKRTRYPRACRKDFI